MRTSQSVRKSLPQIIVKVGNKQVPGRLSGRLNAFATVTVDNDHPCGGAPLWYDFQASWDTIAKCLNCNRPLSAE